MERILFIDHCMCFYTSEHTQVRLGARYCSLYQPPLLFMAKCFNNLIQRSFKIASHCSTSDSIQKHLKMRFPLIISFYSLLFSTLNYSLTSDQNTALLLSCFPGINQSLSQQRGLEIFLKSVEYITNDIFCHFSSGPFVAKLSVAGSGMMKEQLVFPI